LQVLAGAGRCGLSWHKLAHMAGAGRGWQELAGAGRGWQSW